MMNAGEQIKMLRQALGLTRKQLAELTNTTEQIVINTESYNIQKHSEILLKYLVANKEEAIKNLASIQEAIKNIKFEGEEDNESRK